MLNRLAPCTVQRLAMALVVCAVVAGCTRGSKDLEIWVEEVKARPAPPLDPLPVMKQFETFEYAAQGLRDPFTAPVASRDGDGAGPRPDPNRRKEVLEAFPLDSLKMVGTMDSGQGVVGLVLAPDRVTYRVRPNNYLGQNDGRITGVFEDRIDLVELLPDGAGGWLERQARLALDSR